MPTRPPIHRPHGQPAGRRPDHRPSAARRGYGDDWRRLRDRFLATHPTCRCGRPATCVDHVASIHQAPHRRLDPSNLQAMCAACHNAKTIRSDGGFGRPRQYHRDDVPGPAPRPFEE